VLRASLPILRPYVSSRPRRAGSPACWVVTSEHSRKQRATVGFSLVHVDRETCCTARSLEVRLMVEYVGWAALIAAVIVCCLVLLIAAVVAVVRWRVRRRTERAELAKLATLVRAAQLGIADLYGDPGGAR
jgi:hypothetical protein